MSSRIVALLAVLSAACAGKVSKLNSSVDNKIPSTSTGKVMKNSEAKCTLAVVGTEKVLTCGTEVTKVRMINKKMSKKISNPVKGVDDEMTDVMDNPYLCANTFMYPGYGMVSVNGAVTAVYQFDGDLCTYGPEWTWCANAGSLVDSSGAGYAKLNLDGNFVLKSYDHVSYWSTGTQGHQDAYLTMQNDGNLCINSLEGGTFIWCSNGDGGMTDDADVDDDYYLNNFDVEGCSLTDDYGSFVNDDDAPLYSALVGKPSWSTAATTTLFVVGGALGALGMYAYNNRKSQGGYANVAVHELPGYQSTL